MSRLAKMDIERERGRPGLSKRVIKKEWKRNDKRILTEKETGMPAENGDELEKYQARESQEGLSGLI
jgi:hypothetical protein